MQLNVLSSVLSRAACLTARILHVLHACTYSIPHLASHDYVPHVCLSICMSSSKLGGAFSFWCLIVAALYPAAPQIVPLARTAEKCWQPTDWMPKSDDPEFLDKVNSHTCGSC